LPRSATPGRLLCADCAHKECGYGLNEEDQEVIHDSTEGSLRQWGAVRWRKSSHSGTGECVAVADIDEAVAIRNSKHPEAGTVLSAHGGFAAWIAGCKAGEFDDLTV
jgi:hypothetical protein